MKKRKLVEIAIEAAIETISSVGLVRLDKKEVDKEEFSEVMEAIVRNKLISVINGGGE